MGEILRMRDWREYWGRHPASFEPGDFLRQVGKTVNGTPISQEQLGKIVEDIDGALRLRPKDALLDLCCGNGLLTHRLAARCARAVGVDYSGPLIEIAQKKHRRSGVRYIRMSVRDLDALPLLPGTRFDKIVMYEALQHFRHADLHPLLEGLLAWAAPGCRILFGSVPERARRWHFYDTPRRRLGWVLRRFAGTHAIGTWWDPAVLARAGESFGLQARMLRQNPALHTAHYRFDMLLCDSHEDGAGMVA